MRVATGGAELDVLLEIAREAARLVARVYREGFEVELKGPNDPITTADRSSNELICRRLADSFPGVPVVAEESDSERFAGYRDARRVFFVDPLDGTREFVRRRPEFVVMIGLLEDARPRVGVVTSPLSGQAWVGEVGRGAWRIDADGQTTSIETSPTEELGGARVVASRDHPLHVERALRRALGVRELSRMGSAGLKGATVASGDAEAYVSPGHAGNRWDACAIDALITAAGGRFTDSFGALLDYRSEDLVNDRGVIGSNGRLHAALVQMLARSRVP